MVASADLRFLGEIALHFGFDKPVVEPFPARLCQHRSRQVDTDHPVAERPEWERGQSGAAAEIEHRAEFHARPGMRCLHRAEKQLGRAIAQTFGQSLVEPWRITVEQRADISFRHCCGGARAEPHEMDRSAMMVRRICCLRVLESRNGPRAVAELFTQLAEDEPGRGIVGRQLKRLHQQIGGAGKIALRLTIPRPFEAAVGDQISGRQVKRLQLQCLTSVAGAGDFRAYLHAARVVTSGVE